MAFPVPTDKVKDTEYSNWLKVTLALYYMKSGLHSFIQNEVDGLHQSLIQKIYGARTVPLPPCTVCDAHHVKRNKYSGVWTFSKLCNSYCDIWLYELLALHINPKSEKIYWDNSHVASWPFKPWECAKVFMPRGQPPSNVGPAECDAQAMLTMLANCTHFHQKLSPQCLVLSHTISTIRNKVMHDGDMKLSEADRRKYIQQIIQLLEDPVSLKSVEDCKAAVVNIQKIDNDSLDVFFNLDTEMTGLRSAVNELRLEHGMQQTTLDTTNSLKEEYERLRQQLKRVERSIQSVKEQTDMALQQQEKKHQEIQATVTYMSAEVTLHGAKLDTVDKNVEYVYKRMDSNERNVQTVKEQTDMALQQQEMKHQEIQATVTNLSADLTSHGCRLGTVEENVKSFGKELQDFKTNIRTQGEKRSAWKRKMARKWISETPVMKREESDGLRQLKGQTEDKLDTVRMLEYLSTTQTQKAKKVLDGKGSVVIKGNPGEGKTTTALHLIDNEIYENRRVVVYCPGDWKAVDTDWVDIVVFEDILGQFDLDLAHVQDWLVYLPTIQEHVDAGKLQVIITTRVDILSKVYSKLGSIKLFSDIVSLTLSSEELTHSEKMSILNRELQRHQRNMNEDEKGNCISNFKGLIGFPQCCSLFAGDINLFDLGPDFFKSPAKLFVENIAKLEDARFLSLAFLFCNGKISEEYLSPKTMPESSKCLLIELASCLNISKKRASITLLRDTYDSFSGLYVVKSISDKRTHIWFSHATVYEAVGQVLGGRCVEIVVKYGVASYLYQRTYTAEPKDRTSQYVFIPEFLYGLLAERMIHDAVEKGLVETVVKYSALKQHQFLMKLKGELKKGDLVRDFFSDKLQLYRHQDLIEGECITFLQYLLQSNKDVVTLVYSQFLEFLACMHTMNSLNCWQCQEKQNLLELALYYHHFEIADKINALNAYYTHISLCNAARHGDLRRVQTILEALKRCKIFSHVCDNAKDALCRAYMSGNQDVIELFLKEGITLDSKHVVDVVRHGDMSALLKVIEHLKCHNNWNPHLEKYRTHNNIFLPPSRYSCQAVPHEELIMPFCTALYIAYCREKFDMADHLVKNKVILSMNMLPYVFRYSSQQAVSSLMQTLKDTSIWYSNDRDASLALQIAYNTQTYDICDQLMEDGVSLTMGNLPALIMVSDASFESVAKAIWHMKDTDKWDPKCDHASRALEYAYYEKKYDVCDLLIQEGVSLTMKHLPGLILRSFDYVRPVVCQLKDTNSWNPKCDYASRALAFAYSKQKYDVCFLLIQE